MVEDVSKEVGSNNGKLRGSYVIAAHRESSPSKPPLRISFRSVPITGVKSQNQSDDLAASELMHAPMGTRLPLVCDHVQHAVFLRRSSVWAGSPRNCWDCPDRSQWMGTKSTIVLVSFASLATTHARVDSMLEQRSSPACAIQQ